MHPDALHRFLLDAENRPTREAAHLVAYVINGLYRFGAKRPPSVSADDATQEGWLAAMETLRHTTRLGDEDIPAMLARRIRVRVVGLYRAEWRRAGRESDAVVAQPLAPLDDHSWVIAEDIRDFLSDCEPSRRYPHSRRKHKRLLRVFELLLAGAGTLDIAVSLRRTPRAAAVAVSRLRSLIRTRYAPETLPLALQPLAARGNDE